MHGVICVCCASAGTAQNLWRGGGWAGAAPGPPRRGRRLSQRLVGVSLPRSGGRFHPGGAGGAAPLQPSCRRPRGPAAPSGPLGLEPAALGGGLGLLGSACRAGVRGRPPPGADSRNPAQRVPLQKPGLVRAGAATVAELGGPRRPRWWAAPCGAWSARASRAGAGSEPSAWTAAPRSRAASGCRV